MLDPGFSDKRVILSDLIYQKEDIKFVVKNRLISIEQVKVKQQHKQKIYTHLLVKVLDGDSVC